MYNKYKNIKYEFLVLMDFSESSYIALKYAISLAKITDSKIHVYHVGNPGKIAVSDNQVAVLRAFESENKKVEDKLGSIVEIITTEGIQAICHHTIGNIINELEKLIDQVNPDLIVVGKKKEKLRFSGKLTNFLLNKYSGSLLIVGKEIAFQTGTKISIACNGNTLYQYGPQIVSKIDHHTKAPLTLVNVQKLSESNEKLDLPKIWQSFYTMNLNINIEYQNNSSVILGLIEHISEKKIELFCIGRGKYKNTFLNRIFNNYSTPYEIIRRVNIPILIMGTKPTRSLTSNKKVRLDRLTGQAQITQLPHSQSL